MAVVPAWLSEVRRDQLFQTAPLDEPLWGWHQHGWRHINWQREGKKSEFGEQRPFEKQWRDLYQGKQKMQEIFGEHFVPVFSPPWNRLAPATLRILQELNFQAVSVAGPLPRAVRSCGTMPNFKVQIDLHTRKGKNGAADYDALVEELGTLLARRDPVGIMIHHQRMTRFAFEFMDELLNLLKNRARTRFVGFRDILEKRDER
jgi:peptidoglycan/xylan/chitin deacetylase (PgdA/CDA1 family)